MPAAIAVCPGIHSPDLTEHFMKKLRAAVGRPLNWLVVSTQSYPAYSEYHLLQFLDRECVRYGTLPQLSWISFSAGVVGAIGAARQWQRRGGRVGCFIALDGWGVPLYGDFPLYRLSHDRFTHWSSSLLGAGQGGFYADPPVEHLELWRSPERARGWYLDYGGNRRLRTTALAVLADLLARYGRDAAGEDGDRLPGG